MCATTPAGAGHGRAHAAYAPSMNGTLYLADALRRLDSYKRLADRAIAQVEDEDLFVAPGPEANSIAITMKHMAGNMRSRWTDFLTTDGEKPDRHRDTEFEIDEADTKESLMARWEAGWELVFEAIEPLADEDLVRVVHIRGEGQSVFAAIQRQLMHYAYHVGQIVQCAKELVGERWKTLSIPRGESEAFRREMLRERRDTP